MGSLNNCIREYTFQLSKGQIQQAYKGIMTCMSDLRAYLEGKHPDYISSALYNGYMDMTYFAFTPSVLKDLKLKVAVVYLHVECQLVLWLAASNRQMQAYYIEALSQRDISRYHLSKVQPGVDSIIESIIVEQPDFDNFDELKKQVDANTMEFIMDIISMLK